MVFGTDTTAMMIKSKRNFRVPLIKSMMFLAYRLTRDQGIILKACRNLVKNDNAEHE